MGDITTTIAIIGSQTLTEGQRDTVGWLSKHILFSYWGRTPRFVSGGCTGVDIIAELVAHDLGYELEIYRPKNNRWEPEGYKERNILIAEAATILVCIRSRQSKTYGSGWTADYAESIGKEVQRIYV